MSGTIYRKTSLGVQEIPAKQVKLSSMARRVLVLADGRRTESELAFFVRPGDFAPVVQELLDNGLVEIIGTAPGSPASPASAPGFTPASTPAPVAAPSPASNPAAPTAEGPATFDQVKAAAARELLDMLGASGNVIAIRMEMCRTPEELRSALRTLEEAIAITVGDARAKEYVQRIGRALMPDRPA